MCVPVYHPCACRGPAGGEPDRRAQLPLAPGDHGGAGPGRAAGGHHLLLPPRGGQDQHHLSWWTLPAVCRPNPVSGYLLAPDIWYLTSSFMAICFQILLPVLHAVQSRAVSRVEHDAMVYPYPMTFVIYFVFSARHFITISIITAVIFN